MPIEAILKGAKFPRAEVQICMRQDLEFEREEAETKFLHKTGKTADNVRDGRLSGDTRLADDPEASALKARIEELKKEMYDNSLTFHMIGISSTEYNTMQRMAGKPREGNTSDKQVGFNVDAFYKNLVKRCTTKVTSPDGDQAVFEEETWVEFFESINDAQWDFLLSEARKINRDAARTPTMGQN